MSSVGLYLSLLRKVREISKNNKIIIWNFIVAEVLLTLLNLCDDEKEEAMENEIEREKRKERLKAKVRGVSKMLRLYSILVYVFY